MQPPPRSGNVSTTGRIAGLQLDMRVIALAEALANIHGPVHITQERSGLHLYMASPVCLEQYGRDELHKRHLAVNVSKYLRIGQWAAKGGRRAGRIDSCAQCMKTSTPYTITQLLHMPPLSARGIKDTGATVKVVDNSAWLTTDPSGNTIPIGPGDVIPVTQLPPEHPAVWYLTQYRKPYDLERLWRQFRCSFCWREFPESLQPRRRYRPLPAGMKDTPQGRIIFFADQEGIQKSWQGRVIDMIDSAQGVRYVLHPYTGAWTPVESRHPDGKFRPLPEIQQSKYDWSLTKYRNARGSSRNDILFGLDAAVMWNRQQGRTGRDTVAGLVEGPLDAGRVGPPFVALTGKFISPDQADILATRFRRVIFVSDTDPVGLQSREAAAAMFAGRMDLKIIKLEEFGQQGKDLGDLSNEDAETIIKPYYQ